MTLNTVREASSHAIDQIRISGSDVYVAIFSNLSHDHLDYHKTFVNYINAKKLFDNLEKIHFLLLIPMIQELIILPKIQNQKSFTTGKFIVR